jgi:hypothetical protein
MSDDASKMTCEEFQNQLGDLINSGADPEDHPHAKVCVTCGQLVQELEIIAEEARRRFGTWTLTSRRCSSLHIIHIPQTPSITRPLNNPQKAKIWHTSE